jgi:hypothetical protein
MRRPGVPAVLDAATAPRAVLAGVGLAGAGVGAAFAVAPRLGLRVMGLEAEGRGVSLLARLFASRDLAVGMAMLRAARSEPLQAHWLDLIALFQVGDLAFSAALRRTGHLSRRGWAVVLGTATPTLAAALVARLRAAQLSA